MRGEGEVSGGGVGLPRIGVAGHRRENDGGGPPPLLDPVRAVFLLRCGNDDGDVGASRRLAIRQAGRLRYSLRRYWQR
jgi:hypothetical protein